MINVYPSPLQETIDIVHKRVHEGRYFSGGYYNGTVADGASVNLLIQSSSTQATHTKFTGSASGDCTFYIYEGTTFSAAGTAITVSNHNRTSSNVFSGTVTHTPTITADGTQLDGIGFIAGGTKSSGSGGDFGFGNEFLLNASTNYLVRITNNSGGTAKVNIHIEAYQPTL